MASISPQRPACSKRALLKQRGGMLALGLLSAMFSYWLAGGFHHRSQKVAPRVPAASVRPSAPKPPLAYSITSGPRGLLSFIQRLRGAGAEELRTAFFATRDYPLRCAITARWAAVDPAGCFDALSRANKAVPSDFGIFFGMVPLLFDQWAKVDPAAARDAACKAGDLSEFAFAGLIDGCAKTGGETWSALLKDPRFAMSSAPAMGRPRLPGDPVSLLSAMSVAQTAINNGRFAMVDQGTMLRSEGGDIKEAMAAWNQLPAGARRSFTPAIVRELMVQNPKEAAAFVSSLSVSDREAAADDYVSLWAKKEGSASWDWLMQNVQGQRISAAQSWGSSVPPAEGASVLASAPPSRARDMAGVTLAKEWLRTSPAEAGAWIMAIDDPGMKRRIWQSAAETWVQHAPEQAVSAFTAPGAPAMSDSLVKDIAGQLARTRPALAEKFAAGLSPHLAEAARSAMSER